MDPQHRRVLSRLLTRLENLEPGDPLPAIENGRPIGRAFRIGITGPVGSGKSTLINELIRWFRKESFTVGVIAIDPTSPFTGGAVLGDRVRMSGFSQDEGVFIRSYATRGTTGGLAASANDAADLLDAHGFDRIIIETVGVGQTEVDVMEACDVTALVLEPASGDSIQAIKAGLMEIADVFVVNKKDLRGADRFIMDLTATMEMKDSDFRPAVLATLARTGDGVPEFGEWTETWHRDNLSTGRLDKRRAGQRRRRIKRAAEAALAKMVWDTFNPSELDDAANGSAPVRNAAHKIAQSALAKIQGQTAD